MEGMIINEGKSAINIYDPGRSLWKGVIVSHCLYGSEISHNKEGDITQLGKFRIQ